MILSFNSIAFSPSPVWANSHSLLNCAHILADIGYSGIEIIAGRPHAWPYDVRKKQCKKIQNDLLKMGLKIVDICPLISPMYNPASLFREEHLEAQKYFIECVRLASEFQSPYVIYPAGWVVHGTSRKEAWKRSAETLYIAAEEGKKNGVILLIEAIRKVSSNLLWNSRQAVKMMSELVHPNVKLMMDTFHVWAENENIEEVIKIYGHNLRHVHIEDISQSGLERKIPGKGVGDLTKVVSALNEAGYDEALSVEIWGINPEEMARDSFHFLKKLL